MRSTLLKAILVFSSCLIAQAQVNPHTQIRWPTNCAGDPHMAYNWQANTCVQAGPVGNSGEIQINQTGAWFSLPGFNYNFATNTLNTPNLAVSGTSAITIPPTQMTWPTGCSASNYVSYNAASNSCFDVRNNIQAGTTTTLPAGSPATVTQTGTFPNFVLNFGIPAGPTGGSLSYPGVVSDGSNGMNVTGGVQSSSVTSTSVASTTVQSSVNKIINIMAAPYNAKCDGATDDQAAIQAAFNAAGSSYSIQFPAGTCLTSTIIWKGQSFFGAGRNITYVKGQPGQDVFQTPDTNGALNIHSYIHDLNIVVDASVNKAATAGGGDNTFPNRVAGTPQGLGTYVVPISPGSLQGGTQYGSQFGQGRCAGQGVTATAGATTIQIRCSSFPLSTELDNMPPAMSTNVPILINGAGAAGAAYTGTITAVGSTSGGAQTVTISPATSTSVTNASGWMLNAMTPTWYFGNSGMAFQCTNGSTCINKTLHYKFVNIEFDQTNNSGKFGMSHCAGIFSQLNLYGNSFEKIYFQQMYGGFIETAPFSGNAATSDTETFKDMDFYQNYIPFVLGNGSDRVLNGINIYQEYPLELGPFVIGTTNNNGNGVAVGPNSVVNSIYMEGGPSTTGEYARVAASYIVSGANFGQANSGYLEVNASGVIWDGIIGGGLHIDGNQNTFRNSGITFLANIADNGQENEVVSNATTQTWQMRKYNPNPIPPQQPLGRLNGDFIAAGNASTPYLNLSDFITTCKDWAGFNNIALFNPTLCYNDPSGTEFTHSYFQNPTATGRFDLLNGGTVAQNAWAGEPRVFGTSTYSVTGINAVPIPLTKVNVYVMAECVGASTCTAASSNLRDITINGAVGATASLTFSSSWTIQSFVSDLSSATVGNVLGLRLDSWTNTGTSFRVAAWWIQPWRTDAFFSSILYSAAGTALPTCATANKGQQATVSDATTTNGTYTSGGTNTVPVICNGSTWLILATGAVTAGGVADVDVTVPVLTSIPSNTCWGSTGSLTPATFTMSGVTTAMGIRPMDTGNPSAINGWGAVGGLNIRPWASAANQGSYVVCNTGPITITSGSIVIRMGAQ